MWWKSKEQSRFEEIPERFSQWVDFGILGPRNSKDQESLRPKS
jgi:hypothetical protein